MVNNGIPELKVVAWKVENENVVVDIGREKVLLNKSARIVWELIDGIYTVGDIKIQMYEKYKEENTKEYIDEIVDDTIAMFLEYSIIIIRESNDFDGWLEYE